MRNKIVLIASAAISLMTTMPANARDGCDTCIAVIGGMALGAVIANSNHNSHPYQPEYTPSRGPNYNQTNNVPEFNPAYPRSYYYNQDNTVPPPPLSPEVQDQYRLQYGHQPEYRLVNPQPYPEQPRRNRGSRQYQSSSPYPEQPQQNRGSRQYQQYQPYQPY